MGDVKLLAVLGIFLGPYVVLVLFLGSVVGIIVGAVSAGEGGIAHRRIPFGPSLAIAGFLTAIGGPAAWGWYVHLIGLS
jgi:leader peptidase (prepilin peptidase)/N-methyltransferase